MKKRNITVYLVKMLERRSVDLLVLCVTFLKKLSIYRVGGCRLTPVLFAPGFSARS